MKRVTDLEKFALEEIWRPYQNMKGYGKRLERLPVGLEETARLLIADDTGWSKHVLDRITTIGFTFPDYIRHPLVDIVRALSTPNALDEAAIRKDEREKCAKVANAARDNSDKASNPYDGGSGSLGYEAACDDIASAIRYGGKQP